MKAKNKKSKLKYVPSLKKELAFIASKKLPPPPPKKVPPPPPPRQAGQPGDPGITGVLSQLAHRPSTATHIMWQGANKDGVTTTVVIPVNCWGDFSSFKHGAVQWGRLRYGEDFVPVNDDGTDLFDEGPPRVKPVPPPPTGATEADLPSRVTKPGVKREGVCAFIDALIMEGTRSAEAIRDLTVAKFPGRDPQATLSTVKTRPAHIKAKGLVPPPFKK